jgi:peptidoglycan hydrolase-like protein with peptidoglycan-binding domain
MLGFDPGPADGIMGPRTRLATIAFQKACHLIADGIPGKVTQEALRLVLAVPRISGFIPSATSRRSRRSEEGA